MFKCLWQDKSQFPSLIRVGAGLAAGSCLLFGLSVSAGLLSVDLMTSVGRSVEADSFLVKPADFAMAADYTMAEIEPYVEVVTYENPGSLMGKPYTPTTRTAPKWSHWGPGVILDDGRVLTAIGDHGGIDGNSYLYEYNPETMVHRPVADLLSVVEGWNRGDFGFGKVHGRLSLGTDGKVYFSSYWAQESGDNDVFYGDRLFKYDPQTEKLTDLGAPARGWGYPSTHMAADAGVFYAEAVWRNEFDGLDKGWRFLAFDLADNELRFMGGHEGINYGRDFFVDAAGNAYFNNGDRTLVKYDPITNQLTDLGPVMPVSRIRRTAGPGPDGLLYAFSADADETGHRVLFSFDPATSQTRTIARLEPDIPAMAIDDAARYAYLAPRNYRNRVASAKGSPILRVSLEDGSIQVVAFLEDAIKAELGIDSFPYCSYSLMVDGDKVYVQFGIADDLILVKVIPGDLK